MDQVGPDEFAVESRAPLTIPPDFALRPPQPGAPRPQETTAAERARKVIDTAVQAGATRIDNLQFTLKDDSAARNQALRAATQKAKSIEL